MIHRLSPYVVTDPEPFLRIRVDVSQFGELQPGFPKQKKEEAALKPIFLGVIITQTLNPTNPKVDFHKT